MQPLTEVEDKYIKGWSWGAFFGSWVFLFINKQTKLAWKILVVFIVNIFLQFAPWLDVMSLKDIDTYSSALKIVYLGIGIWLGIRGREMVWKSGTYASVQEFQLKQKLVTKINILVIVVTMIGSGFMMYSLVKPYMANPELVDQKVMQEAFADARTRNTNLNDAEFMQGYQAGRIDGENVKLTTSFIADKTSSYQMGYQYGFVVYCMKITNDNASCVKKIMP